MTDKKENELTIGFDMRIFSLMDYFHKKFNLNEDDKKRLGMIMELSFLQGSHLFTEILDYSLNKEIHKKFKKVNPSNRAREV